MNTTDLKRILEGVLLCSSRPLTVAELRQMFAPELPVGADTVRALLDELRLEWSGRPVELTMVASGWRFQSAADVAAFIAKMNPERPPRYSRAILETLAIIAYRQPVTRGDIEEIRGVGVSAQIIRTLEERGWIDPVGVREVPGRPTLFGTTRRFLDDLGLATITDLPAIHVEALAETVDGFADLLDPAAGADAAAVPDAPVVAQVGGGPDGPPAP